MGGIKDKLKTYFRDTDHRILLLALCIYLPFIFLGYGSDYDSYNVVWAGENFAATLDYVPSRVPGFFIYEFIIFFLNLIGGSILTNLASVGMSLLILQHFMRFSKENQVPHYRLLTLILMVHPYYLVNSTCTMDYLFAFGFAFLGLMKFRDRKFFAAAVLMALGIGSRLTTGLVVAVFYLWVFFTKKADRGKIILGGVITACLTVLFYVPSLDFAEWNFAYVSPSVGTEVFWTPMLRIGRWVYKTIYFWSPPVILVLAWGVIRLIAQRAKWTTVTRQECAACQCGNDPGDPILLHVYSHRAGIYDPDNSILVDLAGGGIFRQEESFDHYAGAGAAFEFCQL